MPGTLYVVATPIGNLADLSARAISVLTEVDFIVCEDTRHSRVLLDHYGIKKPLVSLPAFDEGQRADRIVERLLAGESCALVTDAGTPAISDPGEVLVRESVEQNIQVIPVPGPSAVIAALSASGLPTGRFHFVGFLPRKNADRKALLEELVGLSATLVFYESPRRVQETLEDLSRALGDRSGCVAREVTKLHEEFRRGTLKSLHAHYAGADVLGEVVILVEGRRGETRWTEEEVRKALKDGLSQGSKLKPLSVDLAERSGWPGSEIYRLGLNLKDE